MTAPATACHPQPQYGEGGGGGYDVISTSAESASLGHFYLEVTGFLGMKPFEHEFKVMGMAPYAYHKDVERIKKMFDTVLHLDENGEFKQNKKIKDRAMWFLEHLTYERFDNRVVQKLQFLNKFRLKTAKCRAFCETCETTNRVVEQVQYRRRGAAFY